MTRSPDENPSTVRRRITVRGVVQGVGFRPYVWRLAQELSLTGWVRNETDQVVIEIQGDTAQVDHFEAALTEGRISSAPRAPNEEPGFTVKGSHCQFTTFAKINKNSTDEVSAFPLPEAARIETVESQPCETPVVDEAGFSIVTSDDQRRSRPVIPADLATCAECLAEIQTPTERRFAYPFTNCTHCGPRWSIVEGLPYDRSRTSMADFELCADCRAEYEDPSDRRFHAQPVACPVCGPELQLLDARTGTMLAERDEALTATVEAIRQGKIIALKGLGGFQLLVDATDEPAVGRLRDRKRRPDKPLAVMLADLDAVRHYCSVSDNEAKLLTSSAAPIVLLKRTEDRRQKTENRRQRTKLADGVAPGNPELGVMLPYTPLHHLLIKQLERPIVCTSGNLSEEPMATTTVEAIERLGQIADLILTHNRPIVRPVDDSVTRCVSLGAQILRRARGYAPTAIAWTPVSRKACPLVSISNKNIILAVGGHLKNTIGLKLDDRLVVGSHIGDLDTVESVEVHRRAVDDLVDFFGVTPELIACDLHPDYRSTQLAEELSQRWSVPIVRAQHHHAHVAAVAAEYALSSTGDTLGLAWDGTGFGPDGTVWGGEALIDHGDRFERFAHLRPFRLPGGDRAVREPRRTAFGLLHEYNPAEATRRAADWFDASELGPLTMILERQLNSPATSSVGRLFDAVAMLCLTRPAISFEGQAAMKLEFIADPTETVAYPFEIITQHAELPLLLDWQPMLAALLADLDRGVAASIISARFHNGLADAATALAVRSGFGRVILSGGCFLNRRLLESTHRRLLDASLTVFVPMQFPPGDGAISLGQLAIAAHTGPAE